MSFIPKNPLIMPEVEDVSSTLARGTRGLFAGKDGWHDIDADGNTNKIATEKEILDSYRYYNDFGVSPSDASLFTFTINEDGITATATLNKDTRTGDIIIPYECIIDGKRYLVNKIGANSFDSNNGINSIIIPNSVIEIGEYAFNYCGMTTLTIPDSVMLIGDYAFANCVWLKTLEFSKSVYVIRANTCRSCESLRSVIIPASVNEIQSNAFRFCTELDIYYLGDETQWNSINIGDNVAIDNAKKHFGYSSSLKPIESSLTSFTDSTNKLKYYGTTNITPSNASYFTYSDVTSTIRAKSTNISGDIVIPYNYTYNGKTYTITTIGSDGFAMCPNLTSVVIPYGVTKIPTYAFDNCTNLKSVTLPDTITSIGGYAFRNCPNLTSVNIPYNVTTITSYAFSGCTSLRTLVLSDNITTIGLEAFTNCPKLTVVCNQGSYAEKYCINNNINHAYDIVKPSDVYTKEEVDEMIRRIEATLENILSNQATN